VYIKGAFAGVMNEQFNTYLQFMKLLFEKPGICLVLCTEDACFAWIVVFPLQKNELS
jgi:hypothetical protein